MQPASRRAIRFIRALLPHFEASRGTDDLFSIVRVGKKATLEAAEIAALISAGVLLGDKLNCRPGLEARQWLRRQLLAPDDLAAQHREDVRRPDGVLINLAESPLARLAVPARGEAAPYLLPHHVEAGERVRKLTERAQLQPRLTMSYSHAHTANGAAAGPLRHQRPGRGSTQGAGGNPKNPAGRLRRCRARRLRAAQGPANRRK
jgi:hypothetical protein